MPSTVGTSTIGTSTIHPFQEKSFYANGRFWVFYSDATNIVYRTSTDGLTWSDAISIRASTRGDFFSIWFDGTFLHYAYAFDSSIYYRRGTPNLDGTISWSAVEQTVSTTYGSARYPHISVDTSGYVWIGYGDYSSPSYYAYIVKSGNNDGTWGTTPDGFPTLLGSGQSADRWRVSCVPLTLNKMYVVYSYRAVAGLGNLWNGASWEAQETTMSDVEREYGWRVLAHGDDVHIIFNHDTSSNLIYNKRTYGAGTPWGTETTVQATADSTIFPVLSIDTSTGDLYCFWGKKPTANHVYYKKCVSGTWDTDPTDWIDETTDGLTGTEQFTCFYQSYSGYIGLVYMTKTASPYNVRFDFLTIEEEEILITWTGTVNVTHATTRPLRSMKLTQNLQTTHVFLRHRLIPFTQILQTLHSWTVTIPFILKQWTANLQLTHSFRRDRYMKLSQILQATHALTRPFRKIGYSQMLSTLHTFTRPFRKLSYTQIVNVLHALTRPFRFMKLTQNLNLTHAFLLHRYMKFTQALKTLHEWTLPFPLILKQWLAILQATHTFKRPFRTMMLTQTLNVTHAFLRHRYMKLIQNLQALHTLTVTKPFEILKQWFTSLNVTHTFKRPSRMMKFTQALKTLHLWNLPSLIGGDSAFYYYYRKRKKSDHQLFSLIKELLENLK